MDGISNFGKRYFSDFPVYDGPGSDAKLVARIQGVTTQTGESYHQIFTIVFEIDRFNGSTLLTNGVITGGSDEWAIYGGTGVFAMASGVIKRKYVEPRNDGNTDEFAMDVFVPVMVPSGDSQTKVGLWGGKGGSAQDITEPPKRLQSVTIRSDIAIDSIEFTYTDESSQRHTAGRWGGPGGYPHTIDLADSEYVTEISGTYGTFQGVTVLTSFKIVTNERSWGPWANENGKHFTFSVPTSTSVVGFYGSGGTFLDAIGVYLHQL
ncbi:hypothetical protein HU200_038165 [Digitaria exilis]|uniref:Dirigent protein n=1 Tax=Digitaria exilis TaxID=1010633 RepID=A0A835EM39_9POAL|nr:hypothetical protein HU200_038165 [Digitaria exilis]